MTFWEVEVLIVATFFYSLPACVGLSKALWNLDISIWLSLIFSWEAIECDL